MMLLLSPKSCSRPTMSYLTSSRIRSQVIRTSTIKFGNEMLDWYRLHELDGLCIAANPDRLLHPPNLLLLGNALTAHKCVDIKPSKCIFFELNQHASI